jgi:lipid-A-disaccharide synthase
MQNELKIMVVAGEASGDMHAAKLVNALREAAPEISFVFFGATGPHLRDTGVETIVRADDLSIVGIPEIAKALPTFLGAFQRLKAAATVRRADAVILVDFPDFNLRLARSLKKKGLKVFYYISPQLWAWRKYRIGIVRKYVNLLIAILPFEKDWYARHGVEHVEYVGSPLAREVHADTSKDEFCLKYGFDPSRQIVSLLPGSRHKEIVRILPLMLETAAIMAESRPDIQFIIALASERARNDTEIALNSAKKKFKLHELSILVGETFDTLNASDAAAVTSGTATLETAIIGTPMAIVYKTSALNYKLLRPLISVEHFGLVNLIAGERVAKEMIQDDFTAKGLADELFRLLRPDENKEMREKLAETADKLGHGGASRRAAEAILKMLGRESAGL